MVETDLTIRGLELISDIAGASAKRGLPGVRGATPKARGRDVAALIDARFERDGIKLALRERREFIAQINAGHFLVSSQIVRDVAAPNRRDAGAR